MTAGAAQSIDADVLARREDLLEFTFDACPRYQAGWVHRHICDELEAFSHAVAAKQSPRLMIFMPPRHGKSQLSSINLPAWHLGRHPNHEVMVVSYSCVLARKFSRAARRIALEPWYYDTFGVDLATQGADEWTTTQGGGFKAVGIDGSITGTGAHILVLDDLLKNAKGARSVAHREMILEVYRDVLTDRVAPGGGILLLMHRWHDDDLPGRILATEEGWRVVRFPAIAEEDEEHRKKGEALHPERWDLSKMEAQRTRMSPLAWAAKFQQNPMAEGGEMFHRDRLKTYDHRRVEFLPHEPTVISWDLAQSKTEHADRCAGQVWTRRGPDCYIRHGVAQQMDFHSACLSIMAMHEAYPHADIVIESHAWGPAAMVFLREHGIPRVQLWDPKRWGSKEQRVSMAAAYMAAGNIYIPDYSREERWIPDLVTEWVRFPAGVNDDQVDAMSQAVIWLYRQMDRSATGGFSAGAPARRGWARHA